MLDHIWLTLDYEHLYGHKATWADLERRIAEMDARWFCNVLTFISTRLHLDGGGPDQDRQAELVQIIFGRRSTAVFAAMERVMNERHPRPAGVAAFSELQIVNAVKCLALFCDDRKRPGDDEHLPEVGDILLMINDLMDPPLSTEQDEDGFAVELFPHLVAMSVFFRSSVQCYDIVRHSEFFLDRHRAQRDHPQYVDVIDAAAGVLGADPHTVWQILFTASARWTAMQSHQPEDWNGAFHFDRNFRDFDLPEGALMAARRMLVQPYRDFRSEVGRLYGSGDINPIHYLPLARAPVLDFGDVMFGPSTRLIEERCRTAMYHVLLDPDRARVDRTRFLNFFGEIFERYVWGQLQRMFPGGRVLRLDETPLADLRDRRADFVIDYGTDLVLVEAKSGMIPLAARSGKDAGTVRRILQDHYIWPCAQVDATAAQITQGALREQGIGPERVRRFRPMVVLQDPIPMHLPLYEWILRKARDEHGWPRSPQLKVPVFIGIGELEQLPGLLDAGFTLLEFLSDLTTREHRGASLTNYLIGREDVPEVPNHELRARFDQMTDDILAMLKRHEAE